MSKKIYQLHVEQKKFGTKGRGLLRGIQLRRGPVTTHIDRVRLKPIWYKLQVNLLILINKFPTTKWVV